MENNFDPITYSIGDKVIARNKEPDLNGKIPVEQEIVRTETIEYSTGRFCQVLYFTSNPKSFELAFNFEPVDEEEKVKYYEIMDKFTFTKGRSKGKTNLKPKVESKRITIIKNFLKDKSI
jgi:hypothetical protein